MKLLILPDDKFMLQSGTAPTIGREYILEDALEGTGAQNRAWHALAQEYWASGMHSYNAKTFEEFRDLLKLNLGEGFESYVFAVVLNGVLTKGKCKTLEEIPEGAVKWGKLKSWSKYTLKQREKAIDLLIAEMLQAGVNSQKFNEILEGMNEKNF